MDEIRNACSLAEAKKNCFLDSPVAREMGTIFPLSGRHVLDHGCPGVCLKSCRCRWIPTIALGLMDAEALDRRLDACRRSWANALMR